MGIKYSLGLFDLTLGLVLVGQVDNYDEFHF